jgi:hypothetical protein
MELFDIRIRNNSRHLMTLDENTSFRFFSF